MRLTASLVVALVATASADTTDQDLAKYHKLRQRLVTDFTSVGDAPGQSEPAPERTDSAGLMKWGDGTIALGFYLGVLATESYMLAHPQTFPNAGGAPDATYDELYHALEAVERLDNSANAAFPSPCTTTPALDGFFLRDDVPADFSSHFSGITTIESDFIDPTITNKEESQDQVYHVQHGLALVVALVPDSVTSHGKPLRAWALQQAQRITQHFATADWTIRNPACGNRTVARGANAIGYSYGETLAATYVTNGAFVPTTDPFWQNIWNTLRDPANPAYSDVDNLHMSLAIMAVGDGYGSDTPAVIATLAATQDWPLYPLLHRVLHPDAAGFCATAPMVNARARAMLDELPADEEPECPGATPAVHGFTTHNRFIRGKDQAYVGPPGCVGIRYHGLDYMLLHNLYAIATPGTWEGDPNSDPCAIVAHDDVVTDAGTTMPGVDGGGSGSGSGSNGDNGEPPPGCGCQSTAPSAVWPLALAFGLVLRRRRR